MISLGSSSGFKAGLIQQKLRIFLDLPQVMATGQPENALETLSKNI